MSCGGVGDGLGDVHKQAWIEFIFAQSKLFKVIEHEMLEAKVIAPDIYDVLLNLEDAPERMMRMSDLADAVVLSRSGLTRLTDRLERDGLVERKACPKDRRSLYIRLTDKGLAERERAWPYYRRSIGRHFAAYLSPEEAAIIAKAFHRIRLAGSEPTTQENVSGT